MRIRNIAVAAVLAAGATLPFAGIANAQPDRDCPDFASQAEAQAALDAEDGPPEDLDSDNDGIACESDFGEPTTTSAPAPAPTPAPSTTAPDPSGDDSGQV